MTTVTEEIKPDKEYSPAEAAVYLGLSPRQVARLIDAGYFIGWRKSPMPGSHRVMPGRAILERLEQKQKTAVSP